MNVVSVSFFEESEICWLQSNNILESPEIQSERGDPHVHVPPHQMLPQILGREDRAREHPPYRRGITEAQREESSCPRWGDSKTQANSKEPMSCPRRTVAPAGWATSR